MTVPVTTLAVIPYIGNDTTNQFSITFPTFQNSDVVAYAEDQATGILTLMVDGVDYALQGIGIPNQNSQITLVDAGQAWISAGSNLDTGYRLIIKFSDDAYQIANLLNLGRFAPKEFGKVMDRLTMHIKALSAIVDRSMVFTDQDIDNGLDNQMPSMVGNADKLIQVNATEDGLEYGPTVSSIFAAEAAAAASAAAALISENAADASEIAAAASEVAAAASEAAAAVSAAAALVSENNSSDSADLSQYYFDLSQFTLQSRVQSRFTMKSIKFDGATKHVAIPNDATNAHDGNSAFSVSMWIKYLTVDNPDTILGNIASDKGWEILLQSDSRLYFHLFANATTDFMVVRANTVVSLANWHHVVCAYDGAKDAFTSKIYMDGVDATSTPIIDALTSDIDHLGDLFMSIKSDLTKPSDETKTDIAFFDKFLSVAEAAEIYNSGVPADVRLMTMAANLTNYYRPDESTHPTLEDVVGGIDGVMTNMSAADIVIDDPSGPQDIILTAGDNGTLFLADTTNEDLTFTLPPLAGLVSGFKIGILKVSDDLQNIIVESDGAETISGASSLSSDQAGIGILATPDLDDIANNWSGTYFAGGFINDSSAGGGFTIVASQEIIANGEITLIGSSQQMLKVEGFGAAQIANNVPFGSQPADGTIITLMGQDAINTLTISHANIQYGCLLNGDATLGLNDSLTLVYDETAERYYETSRRIY